ncbi:MAG: HAD family hydrolase [Candidatus Kapaibacterium sp.]
MPIHNIIFDFGGVLYDIDPRLSLGEFARLSGRHDILGQPPSHDFEENVIFPFEKGGISAGAFRNAIRRELDFEAPDSEIDRAWNATLIGVRPDSMRLIGELCNAFNLYILSNTNEIHHSKFAPECKELFSMFGNKYFSFKVGMRKPDREIFEYLLNTEKIAPQESLFIDDTAENISAAEDCGIKALHLSGCASLSELLHNV